MTDAPPGTRWIEYVLLDELLTRRHPENPKTHDLPGLVESFRRFGFVDPVIEDGRTSHIMAGHGRLEALDRMRGEGRNVPVPSGLMSDRGTWKVPLTRGWSSRDDDEARALLVALNRHTEAGGWDDRSLVSLLTNLSNSGPEALYGTGFDALQTAALAMLTRGPDVLIPHDPNDEWRGMPGFEPEPPEPQITVKFLNEEDQERFHREVLASCPVAKRVNRAMTVYWPARPHNDLVSVKFEETEAAS